MKLTDTQRAILTAAAQHPQHLAVPPERLPAAARQTVGKALLKADLVVAVHRPDYDARALWTIDGESLLLRITDAGLRAIGVEPVAAAPEAPTQDNSAGAVEPAQGAPGAPDDATRAEDLALLDAALAAPRPAAPRAGLRDAARRVLDAWDDEANGRYDLADAMDALRRVLAKPAPRTRELGAPRKPREGTKQEAVLAMLRRPEGATVAQIAEATGWAPHTVRGFFAGLKKRQGIAVEAAERVRQVGPGKEGAKGSFTIYRIAG
ncbi:hypothetical protein GCM10010964_42160 [Caldovatus sediminis]|uniref:DUF3489 domain-containing protein n=1 Tax=Caldovatus sediminis TaxID=2041189 RepID=A0A8J2ZFB4_9PROT|nr:DUF3489 domain-containing protein [Caldovatus sediminis]GGG50438.1 hypothetical protein GCM10010964_42160 [Caldovatus sediminis]